MSLENISKNITYDLFLEYEYYARYNTIFSKFSIASSEEVAFCMYYNATIGVCLGTAAKIRTLKKNFHRSETAQCRN